MGKRFAVKPRWLAPVVAALLVSFVVAEPSSAAEESTSGAAAKICGEITEGASDNAAKACEQGFTDAGSHATLASSCALGVDAIELVENQHDCKFGFMIAGGVTQSEPTPSSKATSECESITAGASDGSPAACEQGYQDALAGDALDTSCFHLGAGAITAVEYATACEDGWFVAKGEATCIPGADPMNGQPGTTIKSDAATDKTCSSA